MSFCDTWGFSILFLTTVFEFTVVQKKKKKQRFEKSRVKTVAEKNVKIINTFWRWKIKLNKFIENLRAEEEKERERKENGTDIYWTQWIRHYARCIQNHWRCRRTGAGGRCYPHFTHIMMSTECSAEQLALNKCPQNSSHYYFYSAVNIILLSGNGGWLRLCNLLRSYRSKQNQNQKTLLKFTDSGSESNYSLLRSHSEKQIE